MNSSALPLLQRPLVAALLGCLIGSGAVHATGVVPDTSVVIVDEADGEGSIQVRNTDAQPTLLHTSIQSVPEDPADLLVVTPPIARVEGGALQLVRFVLTGNEPLGTQRLVRVTFAGIPPKRQGGNEIQTVIQQNLPVLLQPRDLARNDKPWTLLAWSVENGMLVVRNDSRYVVRLEQRVQLLPTQQVVTLPAAYVLPGRMHTVALPPGATAAERVRIFPATVYGYAVDHYDAPLVRATDGAPARP
ncbi:fimbria/pilus chaperone family protein [Burkholderia lata]|uniref:fimbria/pilus chaperone family protein n=1 Tax=Burkholderia lata (strain ATCC 17760 / DSM 23089 / LMG 22485 / NCIMB 9086 / R18194 / 383) TaxID=482957 RepID=UPI00399C29BE